MTDIAWEEDDESGPDVVGPTGVQVARPEDARRASLTHDPMQLRAGRLKDMVESVERSDTYVVCHKTLDQPANAAVCRGSWDTVYTTPVQIAGRLGFIEEVDESSYDAVEVE